jgi:hypothetical protein
MNMLDKFTKYKNELAKLYGKNSKDFEAALQRANKLFKTEFGMNVFKGAYGTAGWSSSALKYIMDAGGTVLKNVDTGFKQASEATLSSFGKQLSDLMEKGFVKNEELAKLLNKETLGEAIEHVQKGGKLSDFLAAAKIIDGPPTSKFAKELAEKLAKGGSPDEIRKVAEDIDTLLKAGIKEAELSKVMKSADDVADAVGGLSLIKKWKVC